MRKRITKLEGLSPDLIELEVSDRNYICRFNSDGSVNINMGLCLANDEVENFAEKNSFVKSKLDQFSVSFKLFGLFDISNEHVVVEVDELDKKNLFDLKDIQNSDFWDGINVHFIKEKTSADSTTIYGKSIDSGYDVLIWERGVGPTAGLWFWRLLYW